MVTRKLSDVPCASTAGATVPTSISPIASDRSYAVVLLLLLALAMLFVFPQQSQATVYYVDGANGSDSNTGLSWSAAWKSVNRGELPYNGQPPVLRPGDRVEAAAGTYVPSATEGFRFQVDSPNYDSRIVYHANGRVILDGQYTCEQVIFFGRVGTNSGRCRELDGFEITGGIKYGIKSDQYCPGHTIKNCVFRDIGVPGQGIAASYQDASDGWRYYNNVFRSIDGTGSNYSAAIYLWGYTWWGQDPQTQVYNNTFVDCACAYSLAAGGWGICDFKNNIVVGFTGGSLSWTGNPDFPLTHSYNLWWQNGYSPSGEAGAVYADPRFVSREAGNYRLRSDSPAIDAGTPAGLSYIGVKPDMGAFEYDPAAPLSAIRGIVRDYVTRYPIVGALVEAVGEGVSSATASDGTYRLDVAAGSHVVRASKTGYFTDQVIVEVAGGATVFKNIDLAIPGTLTGRVTQNRLSQLPVSGAKVEVVGSFVSTTTDGQGNYTLTLPSGMRNIRVSRPGFVSKEQSLTIQASQTLTCNFTLDLPPTVALTPGEKDRMLENYFERMSAPQHMSFSDLATWQTRRAFVRQTVLRTLGLDPLPERLPLNITYGGSLDRGDYILKRVYWQSWPGVYASGWLYMPKNISGKIPGIINPHGHWENGAMNPVVQSRCIGLAKKGYVALAIDKVHTNHPYDYLVGMHSVGIMIWNDMRAIDLLETLPEVDATRIGCTGASGGGQETMYMMATDDRVKAAVPAVLISYFYRILFPTENTHTYCNFIPDLLRYTDEPEISATFAPKPALYLTVTGDWTAQFPFEEFPEIQSIWSLYGAAGDTNCLQWNQGHDYNQPMREAMYAWFNKYLKGITDPAQATEPAITTETIATMQSLNLPTYPGARSFFQVHDDYQNRFGFVEPSPASASEWLDYLAGLRTSLADRLGDVPVTGRLVEQLPSAVVSGLTVEKYRIRSEPEIDVPALLFRPSGALNPPVVIMIHPGGKSSIVAENLSLIQQILAGGRAVFLPDVRLTGELAREWTPNTVIWGRPTAGMALTDLRACLDFIAALAGLDQGRTALVALGDSGATALFAGAMEPRFLSVAALNVGNTYRTGRLYPTVSNILRVGDLQQVAAAIAPRPVLIGGATGFDFTSRAYTGVGAPDKSTIQSSEVAASTLDTWLQSSIPHSTGNVYYVNGSTGSDANDGLTPATAWKNIDRGEGRDGIPAILAPGDTVMIAEGTYKPGVGPYTFKISGASGAPITYKATGRVVIDGEYINQEQLFSFGANVSYRVVDGFVFTRGKNRAIKGSGYGADNIAIKNCEFVNIGVSTAQGGNQVFCVDQTGCNNWIYQNNVFHSMTSPDYGYEGGIVLYYNSTASFYNNTFDNCGLYAVLPAPGTISVFKNNIISNSENAAFYQGAVPAEHSHNLYYNVPNPPTFALGVGEVISSSAEWDPMYASPGLNYRLRAASPVIDRGTGVGLPYIGSAPDLGAYEHDPTAAPVTINGTVRDTDGGGISGATVELVGEGLSTVTASTGAYTLTSPAAGMHKVQASLSGYFTEYAIVNLQSGATVVKDFILAGQGSIAGKVTQNKPGNPPIPGANVEVRGTSSMVFTDENGNYSLDTSSGGRIVQVSYPGFVTAEEPVVVPSGGTVTKDVALNQVPPVDYYVKPAAIGGDNGNSGLSWSNAWADIDNGDKRGLLKPGDVVHVWPGTYTHAQNWTIISSNCSGTPIAPITYQAETDPSNPLARVVLTQGLSTGSYGIYTYSTAQYNTFDGFEVTATQDGVGVAGRGTVIRNCYIHDLAASSGASYSRALNIWAADFVATNNVITDMEDPYHPGDFTDVQAVQFMSSNALVANNTIGRTRKATRYGSSTNRFVNNIVVEMQGTALGANATGFRHSHNLLWNNAADYAEGFAPGEGEFNIDPMFVNPSGTPPNYRLRRGSPAVNSGVDIGLPYIGTAPDRGAFESEFTDPASGWVEGVVTDASTGQAIEGARVDILDVASVATDSVGYYKLFVPAGAQTIRAAALGYAPQESVVEVTVETGTIVNFSLVAATAPFSFDRIGILKKHPFPAYIRLTTAKVATSASAWAGIGGFYIEEPDRSNGIRIVPDAGLPSVIEGDRVTLTGRLNLDENGEMCIYASSIDSKTIGAKLRPLGMKNRDVERATGLLVKVWGDVKFKAADGSYVYVEDDGHFYDGAGVARGIRVLTGGVSAPSEGFAVFTGIAGRVQTSSGNIPVVRLNNSTSVKSAYTKVSYVSGPEVMYDSIRYLWGGHTFGYTIESPDAIFWSANHYDPGTTYSKRVIVGQHPKPGSSVVSAQTIISFDSPEWYYTNPPQMVRTPDGYLHIFVGAYRPQVSGQIWGTIHYYRSARPNDITELVDRTSLIPLVGFNSFHIRQNVGVSPDGSKMALVTLAWPTNTYPVAGNTPVIFRGTRSGPDFVFSNPVQYAEPMGLFYPQVCTRNDGQIIIVGEVW
ncbi:MAG: carboxypeptidase regulatory-like domain-containing protein, partial [Armatimonadetes bacterium]|nr:carboxypeptidase regulatory-like domain-containing protein [Armatimonadota bacterium]